MFFKLAFSLLALNWVNCFRFLSFTHMFYLQYAWILKNSNNDCKWDTKVLGVQKSNKSFFFLSPQVFSLLLAEIVSVKNKITDYPTCLLLRKKNIHSLITHNESNSSVWDRTILLGWSKKKERNLCWSKALALRPLAKTPFLSLPFPSLHFPFWKIENFRNLSWIWS